MVNKDRIEERNALEAFVKARVDEIAAPLLEIIGAVNNALKVKANFGQIETDSRLDKDDLYNLAVKIPVECVYIQAVINEYTSGYAIGDIMAGNKITEQIGLERQSPGDARERQRRAEQKLEDELLIVEARKQIATSLQGIVHRADKVYEGIKKVIDASIRESWINGKVQ